MSRFLEFNVHGTVENVPERARRAFQSVGRIRSFDPVEGISGTIRAGSQTSQVEVKWKPGRADGKIQLEITARTEQASNRDGDAALYGFVRAYRETPWPDAESDAKARKRKLLRWVLAGSVLAAAAAAAVWVALH